MTRRKQFLSAFLIIGFIMSALGLWAARFLPDPIGGICARIFHIITTPIILEISFGVLGICIVLALAHYNEKRSDEWVEMDFPDEK